LISIITDSTCDIPDALIKQHGITVIPHTVIWGDDQYLDRVDLQPEEFYRRLVQDPQRPTTSHAGLVDFKKAYEKAASEGADEIIALTVSSKMSGTYGVALQAAESSPVPVHVIDSKGPTMSLGWQVLAAARARDAGAGIKEILNCVERVRSKLVQLVCMDTLEYLEKGGRIGKAAQWIGVKLHVRPLVSINHQTGLVEPVSLARTQKGAVEDLYRKFTSLLRYGKNLHVAVLHGNAWDKAEQLAQRIQKDLNPVETLINITGPVLGINTGPGALALCGYAEE